MLKDYKSKTTIKAFQVTESLFDDYRNAYQAQKLPTKEIHFTIEDKFCTLNCDNNTLIYQGIVLNVGDYLIKSGNSFEPCPKDKFEEDFGIEEVLCGECNHEPEKIEGTLLETMQEETIERVEEIIKENPETAPFLGKVKDIVKSIMFPKESAEEMNNKVILTKQEYDDIQLSLHDLLEYGYNRLMLNEDFYAGQQITTVTDEILKSLKMNDESLKHVHETVLRQSNQIGNVISAYKECFDNDFNDDIHRNFDELMDELVNGLKLHSPSQNTLNAVANAETEEEQNLRLTEQISYLMGLLNISSVERKEEDGVMVNHITYNPETPQENSN